MVGFLRNDLKTILEVVGKEFEEELQPLSALLPWPEIAITAYSVFSNLGVEACLTHSVRANLGLYTMDPMHTIKGGMSSIAWAFMNENCYSWNMQGCPFVQLYQVWTHCQRNRVPYGS